MTDHPPLEHRDRSDHADDQLRSRLRELRPGASAIDELGARVLAQWSEQHRHAGRTTLHLGGTMGTAEFGLGRSHRRLRAGLASGLVVCAIVAAVMWAQRPDPTLDELIQADVLSQMAIGEM